MLQIWLRLENKLFWRHSSSVVATDVSVKINWDVIVLNKESFTNMLCIGTTINPLINISAGANTAWIVILDNEPGYWEGGRVSSMCEMAPGTWHCTDCTGHITSFNVTAWSCDLLNIKHIYRYCVTCCIYHNQEKI